MTYANEPILSVNIILLKYNNISTISNYEYRCIHLNLIQLTSIVHCIGLYLPYLL